MPRLNLLELQDSAIACCAPLAATALTGEEAEETAPVLLKKSAGRPSPRLRILNLLLSSDEPVCACDLFPATQLAQPTVSFHLKKLLEAGLIRREERGGRGAYDPWMRMRWLGCDISWMFAKAPGDRCDD